MCSVGHCVWLKLADGCLEMLLQMSDANHSVYCGTELIACCGMLTNSWNSNLTYVWFAYWTAPLVKHNMYQPNNVCSPALQTHNDILKRMSLITSATPHARTLHSISRIVVLWVSNQQTQASILYRQCWLKVFGNPVSCVNSQHQFQCLSTPLRMAKKTQLLATAARLRNRPSQAQRPVSTMLPLRLTPRRGMTSCQSCMWLW